MGWLWSPAGPEGGRAMRKARRDPAPWKASFGSLPPSPAVCWHLGEAHWRLAPSSARTACPAPQAGRPKRQLLTLVPASPWPVRPYRCKRDQVNRSTLCLGASLAFLGGPWLCPGRPGPRNTAKSQPPMPLLSPATTQPPLTGVPWMPAGEALGSGWVMSPHGSHQCSPSHQTVV